MINYCHLHCTHRRLANWNWLWSNSVIKVHLFVGLGPSSTPGWTCSSDGLWFHYYSRQWHFDSGCLTRLEGLWSHCYSRQWHFDCGLYLKLTWGVSLVWLKGIQTSITYTHTHIKTCTAWIEQFSFPLNMSEPSALINCPPLPAKLNFKAIQGDLGLPPHSKLLIPIHSVTLPCV